MWLTDKTKQNDIVMIKKLHLFAIVIIGIIVFYYVFWSFQGSACDADLEAAIQNGISSELRSQQKAYSWMTLESAASFFNIEGSGRFNFENGIYFDCRKGAYSGENVNYLYCDGSSGDSTKYNNIPIHIISTNNNGDVIEDFKIAVNPIIDASNNRTVIVNLNCHKVLW